MEVLVFEDGKFKSRNDGVKKVTRVERVSATGRQDVTAASIIQGYGYRRFQVQEDHGDDQ